MIRLSKLPRMLQIRLLPSSLAALLMLGMHVQDAHAYLDPGTGSILLQSILALIAGTAVTLRLYWSKLKALLWRQTNETDRPADHNG
jgi:hypothetical protein